MSAPQQEQWVPMFQAHQTLYPRAVSGRFVNLRWWVVFLTQAVFYGVPWVQFHDRQAFLFDLVNRRFYIGGIVFYPQDLIYLSGLLVVCALGLFLVTAVAGRVWCGYGCPQTVYTEIFMWIERRIEGDRNARIKLDNGPVSLERVWKKSAKHSAWMAVGLYTGFTFVGYFTPIRQLAAELSAGAFGPWETFWVLFYGFATYGNAGFMREQVCKYMCPYARFQSAMFDQDTWIVSYDKGRGEPRGSRARSAKLEDTGLGACIDCTLCVQVCPTGIDIRKGLQYECIGCAACIDVCDTVMDKMGYDRGLIRYSTERAQGRHVPLSDRLRGLMRPRVLVYSTLLWVISAALMLGLFTRDAFKVDVVRDRNSMGRIVEDGHIENVYRLQVMNTTEHVLKLAITAPDLPGAKVMVDGPVVIQPTRGEWIPVRVQVQDPTVSGLSAGSHTFHFVVSTTMTRIRADDSTVDAPDIVAVGAESVKEKAVFIVPRN